MDKDKLLEIIQSSRRGLLLEYHDRLNDRLIVALTDSRLTEDDVKHIASYHKNAMWDIQYYDGNKIREKE